MDQRSRDRLIIGRLEISAISLLKGLPAKLRDPGHKPRKMMCFNEEHRSQTSFELLMLVIQ